MSQRLTLTFRFTSHENTDIKQLRNKTLKNTLEVKSLDNRIRIVIYTQFIVVVVVVINFRSASNVYTRNSYENLGT